MTAKNYREENFEDHVVERLVESGYRQRQPSEYDRELVLIPEDVIAFIRATQPKEYERLEKQYGTNTDRNICLRLTGQIQQRGVLDVLRKGIKDRGVRLRLVYFRPSSTLNPDHARLYSENRFSVIRQLAYSQKTTHELDLGIFINGIPIITAELKNALTGQFVDEAKKQYRKQRDSREPLFHFGRCVAHFAVGNEEVHYTTRLADDATFFLPFNQGTEDGGEGNPVNEQGHATAYLWEDVWQNDTLLDLLQNYLHVQRETERVYDRKKGKIVEKEKTTLIFPRYHQLDVVRQLLVEAKADGAGASYLVQHSAGSGKSNSIAWLSHQLRQLHDADGDRLFDTIIVVTDRRVLDQQLQQTIKQFEQTAGTVVPITKTSVQLKEALEHGKDIVVTTLQKFPVISETMGHLPGQHFAVIIDEAHSSQSGESARHLNRTLSAGLEDAEEEDSDDEPDLEDKIVEEIQARGRQQHISYFAFTATPKNKTLELFGRKTDEGFEPHHTYTMRQAIEEKFILDVLKNYTTFKRYFKLVTSVDDDEQVEKNKATRALTSYVDLTDHAIEQKASICLEHFLNSTERQIQGRARAMFVTRSRLHAVRYFLKFKQLMQAKGLSYGPLVAFSGTVRDPDTGAEHTENSLNALPPKTSIKDAFKLPGYRLLVVANKFQTGFDEPLLHTMYVDKKLGGVSAVQTLSRLNRTTRGKTETVVLDFVNEPEEIQEAFQRYYQQSTLEEETDPNKLYDLQTQLRDFEIYTEKDVEDLAEVFFDDRLPGEKLQPILDRVVKYWQERSEDEREDFRSLLQQFVRLYGYVAQLIDFVDSELEKEYIFARHLNKKLPKRKGGGLPQVTDSVDLDSFRIQQKFEGAIELEKQDGKLKGISTEVGKAAEPDVDYLSNIIEALNNTYGVELSDKDRVRVDEIIREVREDEGVHAVMNGNNSRANKERKVHDVIDKRILEVVNHSIELYQKLSEPRVNELFKRRLYEEIDTRGTRAM